MYYKIKQHHKVGDPIEPLRAAGFRPNLASIFAYFYHSRIPSFSNCNKLSHANGSLQSTITVNADWPFRAVRFYQTRYKYCHWLFDMCTKFDRNSSTGFRTATKTIIYLPNKPFNKTISFMSEKFFGCFKTLRKKQCKQELFSFRIFSLKNC